MDNRSPSMLKSTLIAGLTTGVITALPGINVLNLCTCCSLVVLGGFFASYLYSRECRLAGAEFRPGSGALVGLVSGAFWAIATTIVAAVLLATVGNPAVKWLLERLSENPQLPPEALDQVEKTLQQLESVRFSAVRLILEFFQHVIVGAIFSTLGGLIGGAVFKVEPPPPVPEASPPLQP